MTSISLPDVGDRAPEDLPDRGADLPPIDEAAAAFDFVARLARAEGPQEMAEAVVDTVLRLGASRAAFAFGTPPVVLASTGWDPQASVDIGATCSVEALDGEAHPTPAAQLLDGASAQQDLVVAVGRPPSSTSSAVLILDAAECRSPGCAAHRHAGGIVDAAAAALQHLADDVADRPRGARDALTGRASRRAVEDVLGRPASGTRSVVSCDLDRFQRINSALGDAAGDALLRVVAARLTAAAGIGACVARTGGDRFAVAVDDLGDAELELLLQRLEAALRPSVRIAGQLLYPSASFGRATAAVPAVGRSAAAIALLRAAEADMRAVKERRRSRSPQGDAFDLLQLDADLHLALDRDEVTAHFQPVYDLGSGRLVAYEALARWQHPSLGAVPPDVFVAIAEDDGLIHRLGDRMFEEAGRFLAGHPDRALELYVNVSSKQLAVPGFARRVVGLLGDDPDRIARLTVEITETAAMLDHELIESELLQLRAAGVGVAIDDFGSGYSSLSQLQDLPVTELKIDRALVQRSGVVGHGILDAVLRLAERLDLRVVAEGVELLEQLEMLQELGCDRVQGFLFCPALPADVAVTLPATFHDLVTSELGALRRPAQEDRPSDR